jgi:hypothetical protein
MVRGVAINGTFGLINGMSDLSVEWREGGSTWWVTIKLSSAAKIHRELASNSLNIIHYLFPTIP